MRISAGRLSKVGAIFYVLWGIMHIVVGLFPVATLLVAGRVAMLEAIPGMQGVPGMAIEEPMRHASNLIAQHYFNLAAFGVLAIVVALTLNWRNRALGFWLNLVVLGMVDLAFILAEIVPGYMPLGMGIIGPLLYLLGVAFTGAAFMAERSVAPAKEGVWARAR